jgi:C-terminal processing protease CtpA/Prc
MRIFLRFIPRMMVMVAVTGAGAWFGAAGCAPQLGTIGAVLGQAPDGRLFVRETPPRLAAARQGLAPGDEILLVDGKDVRQMGERELYATLSGDVGTSVNLTVARGEKVMRVRLVRTPAPAMATGGRGQSREGR